MPAGAWSLSVSIEFSQLLSKLIGASDTPVCIVIVPNAKPKLETTPFANKNDKVVVSRDV